MNLLISVIMLTVPAFSQKKYALFIGGIIGDAHKSTFLGGIPGVENDYNMFWNDTFVMWQLLTDPTIQNNLGYDLQNVQFLFNSGNDYSGPYGKWPDRYKVTQGQTPATTAPCLQDSLNSAFAYIRDKIQDDPPFSDFLFVYVCTHGYWDPVTDKYYLLIPQTIKNEIGDYIYPDDWMLAEEFTAQINSIHAQKTVIWMQPCYSGGSSPPNDYDGTFPSFFYDNGNNNSTPSAIYISGAKKDEFAHQADNWCDCFTCSFQENEEYSIGSWELIDGVWQYVNKVYPTYHGEFSYHMFSATNGKTPDDQDYYNYEPLNNADNHPNDGIISVKEAFDWENNHSTFKSPCWHGFTYDTYETPFYQESQSIQGSNINGYTTSLKYPNLIHNLNDLIALQYSDNSCRGIYGIANSITITNGQTIDFEDAIIYLLNNASIIVQNYGNLTLGNNVTLYGRGYNTIDIFGNCTVETGVTFSKDPDRTDGPDYFGGLQIHSANNSYSLNSVTFDHSNLMNMSNSLQVSGSNFIKGVINLNAGNAYFTNSTSFMDNSQIINNGTTLTCSNSTFSGSSIRSFNGTNTIEYCDFYPDNSQTEPVSWVDLLNINNNDYMQTIAYCTFFNNSAITLDNIKKYNIHHNTIYQDQFGGRDDDAITLLHAGNGTTLNQIAYNAISYYDDGIKVVNSSGEVKDNTIQYCTFGVCTFSNSNIQLHGHPSFIGMNQSINNNTIYQIYSDLYSFPNNFHYNIISGIDDGGSSNYPWINWVAAGEYPYADVTQNCWGSNFDLQTDLCCGASWGVDPVYCGYIQPILPPITLYDTAIVNFDSGNYVLAKAQFKAIVELAPKSLAAQNSLKELFDLEKFVRNDYYGLQQYYLTNDSIVSEPSLSLIGQYYANRCNEKLGDWAEEISWYESKIVDAQSQQDSVELALDLSWIYILMKEDSSTNQYQGSLPQFEPDSLPAYFVIRDSLIRLLPCIAPEQKENSSFSQPNLGKFLKILPNPFNSNVEISFNILAAGLCKIKLYDTFMKLEAEEEINANKGLNKVSIEGSKLSFGVHHCVLEIKGLKADSKTLLKTE
jgi:hypothetical protein